jgi:hypothetical protein
VFHEPYRGALVNSGLSIVGACFPGNTQLKGHEIPFDLRLERSSFEGSLAIDVRKIDGEVNLDGSAVLSDFEMQESTIALSLFLSNGDFGSVTLTGSRFGSTLDLENSIVKGTVGLDSVEVQESVFLNGERADFGTVTMIGAHVRRQIRIDRGARIRNVIDLDHVEVGGAVILYQLPLVGSVDARGASIGASLEIVGTHVERQLIFDSARVGGHVRVRKSTVGAELLGAYSSIARNLDLSGSRLFKADLTGANIGDELRFAAANREPVSWKAGSTLSLRGTTAKAMEDAEAAWFREDGSDLPIILDGFEYGRLGSFRPTSPGETGSNSVDEPGLRVWDRDSDWFISWLDQQESFSPQPWSQLAKVLEDAGQPERAIDILYERSNRDRGSDPWEWLKWAVIGYGYRVWLAMLWLTMFLIAGTVAYGGTTEGAEQPLKERMAFSLDLLLPIIKLREKHYSADLNGWARYYFYAHQLIGLVLVTLLAGALSGLIR